MTWEETIKYARTQDSFHQLIKDAYLEEDLVKNCQRFIQSTEFKETLHLIQRNFKNNIHPSSIQLLDIGAGNGISSIAFAKENYRVTAIEPDASETLGYKAIQKLKSNYLLSNLEIHSAYGESLPFKNDTFDIVYARQAMHHAKDLTQFIREASRVLKKGGLLITVRDHVVNDLNQKKEFLNSHPFQKYYQGENAYALEEYTMAFKKAGFILLQTIGPLDSTINYHPKTKSDFAEEFRMILKKKIKSTLMQSKYIDKLLFYLFKWRSKNMQQVAGRLYSFVAQKP